MIGCPLENHPGHKNRDTPITFRWQSYLSGMTAAEAEEWGVDDSQRPYFVRFGVSKANYGAPFKDRWFRRHDGGVLKPAVLEKQRKSKGVRRGEA